MTSPYSLNEETHVQKHYLEFWTMAAATHKVSIKINEYLNMQVAHHTCEENSRGGDRHGKIHTPEVD